MPTHFAHAIRYDVFIGYISNDLSNHRWAARPQKPFALALS